MRIPIQAVCGLALLVVTIAGCAASRPAGNEPLNWNADQGLSLTVQSTSNRTFTSRAKPGGTIADDPRDEFAFSHPRIDDFVAQFQTNLRQFFSGALSRSGRYVPRMAPILEKEGVPAELAYLPLIESGFREHAVSRAGAVGPWQLIPGTGRRYGLRIDSYVDERRDPVKSTQAAARYLRDLHDMFGSWHLSLAAYNTGEGNISRILERGHADDFWEMSNRGYLHHETENYVPEFLAALHIAETPEAYGFEAPEPAPLRYDLVKVKRSLQLNTVARLSGASADEIKDLNPALRRGVIPPQGYLVRLPKGTKETFQVALATYVEEPAPRVTHRGGKRHGKGVSRKGPAKRVAREGLGKRVSHHAHARHGRAVVVARR
jgi:hypothetical protein